MVSPIFSFQIQRESNAWEDNWCPYFLRICSISSFLLKSTLFPHSLSFHKFCKKAVFCDQFLICPIFRDPAAIQHDNAVTLPDRGKPVCDDNSCTFQSIQ